MLFVKKMIISTCVFFSINYSSAQDNAANLSKYWHYRYRLTHYFMAVGPGRGESIPAGIRNLYNGGQMHWGDGPVYLGYYIGVLATEYNLLKRNNQPVDQTLTELFYALNALKRLDENAEQYWAKPNSLNGFIISDDVPSDFIQTHPQLNLNIPLTQTTSLTGSGDVAIVNQVNSSFSGNPRNTASQDQLYNILVGLALTKKFVAYGNISFTDQISNTLKTYDFNGFAIAQADRIVSYIRNSPFDNSIPWRLQKPDGTPVGAAAGGDAIAFSYGVSRAGQYFTGTDYNNVISLANKPTWQQFQSDLCARADASNITFSLMLAAIGNSWNDLNPFSSVNTTKDGIRHQGDYGPGNCVGFSWFANHYGWELYYGAINRLLYDGNLFESPGLDMCNFQNILNAAPYGGPYLHTDYPTYDRALHGWACSFRFYGEPPDQDAGKISFNGNYNGLDYMLFHNLYYLLNEGTDYIPTAIPRRVKNYYPPPLSNVWTKGYHNEWGEDIPFQYRNSYRYVLMQNTRITDIDGWYYGVAEIAGGPQGILIDNVYVEPGASLDIYTVDACAVHPLNYLFNPNDYK